MFDPVPPFRACEFQIKRATDPWERRGAVALRRAVFCAEQGLFQGSDRDGIDNLAITLVALSLLGIAADAVVGTVRIHEETQGIWWGSRLAVAQEYRRVGALGAGLIQLAVSTAHALGCREFHAHVQAQNGPLFTRLHWSVLEEVTLHGHPHLRMRADLDFYPPCTTPETGFIALARKAA
jgi:putative N-acetyltransferase (TIGR04045 family)